MVLSDFLHAVHSGDLAVLTLLDLSLHSTALITLRFSVVLT